jgi:type III restriction enzyme
MLKEGWDVTNLYTIVPLRAANARTLIEQSIGRGLRLPYGKRTGVTAVDRLNIVAHDRFQEIIDEANRGDSPIRLKQVILEAPEHDESTVSVKVNSTAEQLMGLHEPAITPASGTEYEIPSEQVVAEIFTTPAGKQAATVVMEVIQEMEKRRVDVPTSAALLNPEVQKVIAAQVAERLTPAQSELFENETLDIAALVAKATEIISNNIIDIPRIAVVPTGEVTVGFRPFTLDVNGLHLQPGERELVLHNLHTNEQDTLAAEVSITEQRLEDYIVYALFDFDDIDYFAHAELLYDLAGQMVRYFLSYLSEDEVRNVLEKNHRTIAKEIHSQMMAHFWEKAPGYEVHVSRGFTALKPCNFTASAKNPVYSFRETVEDKNRIKQMMFGGFEKCLYPLQKFDSDSERRFSVILERNADKWFRPVKGQFQVFYKSGSEQPEYVPDFVAESADKIYMAETKARSDLADVDVQAKADAAVTWCQNATEYTQANGGKPWVYLMIPHDEINEGRRLVDYERFERK